MGLKMTENEKIKMFERAEKFDKQYVDMIEKLKQQIEFEMKHRNMNRQQLCDEIGLTYTGLTMMLNYHRGMNIQTLLKICNVMKMKITIE